MQGIFGWGRHEGDQEGLERPSALGDG